MTFLAAVEMIDAIVEAVTFSQTIEPGFEEPRMARTTLFAIDVTLISALQTDTFRHQILSVDTEPKMPTSPIATEFTDTTSTDTVACVQFTPLLPTAPRMAT